MRKSRNVITILLPIFLYLISAILIGCGGVGGDASGGSGSAGGNSGGGSGGSNSGGGTGGETGGGTGGETGGGSGGGTGGETGGGSGGGSGGGTGGETGGGSGGGTGGSGGGEGLIYFLSDKDGPLAVYRVNLNGTGLSMVGSEQDVAGPNVSWDGSTVVYEKWGLYSDVYRMGSDGSNPTEVYAAEVDNKNPCLSPDGQFVIFSMSDGGAPQLFRTTVNGDNLTQLTSDPDGATWGRYSPDGTKIVYSTSTGDIDIKLMNADGSGVITLVGGAAAQENPAFSPSGEFVTFCQDYGTAFDPNYQIMVVSASGGSPARLTTTLQDDRWPCFSTDGQFIAFSRLIEGNRHIFYIPAAGGGATQVTDFGGFIGWLSAGGG